MSIREIALTQEEIDEIVKSEDECGVNTLLQEMFTYSSRFVVFGYFDTMNELVGYKVKGV